MRPFLSLVFTGRNDDYGADFRSRLFRALRFNHRQLAARGIGHEFVLVEWAPEPGRPLLADLVHAELPELPADALSVYVVDGRYQEALTLGPPYLEYVAKNVGLRRAAGEFVLATNPDICVGRRVLERLAQRDLRPRVLYRALRYDLRLDLGDAPLDWTLLEDPANREADLPPLRPPLYAGGIGDFVLLHRDALHELRGFNEVYRHARLGVDGTIVVKAYATGMAIEDIGGPVYHLNHAGSHRLTRTLQSIPWGDKRTGRGLLYDNPPAWGLGTAPAAPFGPRRWRLEFSWDAVPPPVDLHRIQLPADPPARGERRPHVSES